jgi:uncharacterized protein YjbJ (UPF0337 family)
MNTDVLQAKWDQLRGDVKTNWGKLTDNDLDVIAGRRDKLEGMLREKYGYTKEKVQEEVDTYLEDLDDTTNRLTGRVKSAVHDAQGKLSKSTNRAKRAVQEKAEQANQSLEEVASRAPQSVVTAVQDYPWLAVAAVLVVGVAIGLLFRQRSQM